VVERTCLIAKLACQHPDSEEAQLAVLRQLVLYVKVGVLRR